MFLKKIILLLGLGLPIGFFIYQYLPQQALIILLGFVMIFAGSMGIAKLQGAMIEIKSKIVMVLLLFIGGILQGAFVTGGPLIVICASLLLTDKDQFRATLSLLWSVLNTIILIQLIINGSFSPTITKAILINLPALFVAVILGQYVAGRVPKRFFDYILNGTLCLGGMFTIINQLIIY
ncbi:MAG: TSUP family transporter [Brevinema sp.]